MEVRRDGRNNRLILRLMICAIISKTSLSLSFTLWVYEAYHNDNFNYINYNVCVCVWGGVEGVCVCNYFNLY